MGVRVLKFGGTSLASAARLADVVTIVGRVASRLAPALSQLPLSPARPVVVVSALAGVTNELFTAVRLALAGDPTGGGIVSRLGGRHRALLVAAAGDPERHAAVGEAWRAMELVLAALGRNLTHLAATSARATGDLPTSGSTRPVERRGGEEAKVAAVVAAGERLAAPLVAATLATSREASCIHAVAIDAGELLVANANSPLTAEIDLEATRERVTSWFGRLPLGVVPVVTGYLAGSAEGQTVLLGRGASDYTAGILAGCLAADRVEIWTDVDGILTADPKLVAGARPLAEVTAAAVVELAWYGAKVLHPRTLEPLAGLPTEVWVGNTARPDQPGTRIVRGETTRPFDGAAAGGVRAISSVDGVSLLTTTTPREPSDLSRWGATREPAGVDRALLTVSQLGSQAAAAFVVATADLPSRDEPADNLVGMTRCDGLALLAVVGDREPSLAARAGRSATGGLARTVAGAYKALDRAGVVVHLASFGGSPTCFLLVVAAGELRRALGALHRELIESRASAARHHQQRPPVLPSTKFLTDPDRAPAMTRSVS